MLATLLLLPPIAAALTLLRIPDRARLQILRVAAFGHLALALALWMRPFGALFGGYVSLDAVGLLVLSPTSALFAGVSVYLGGYLARAERRSHRVFIAALLVLEGALTLACASQHLGLFWVALETSTLVSAPLIYFHHTGRALEATWKYLIVGSVGIALALLGTFLLAAAQSAQPGTGRPLILDDLVAAAPLLHAGWLKAACVFLLVGFGTKMGLVPLHTWKPDTYGEAPSLVAGLMAGALTACAFLALTRMMQVVVAAGLVDFLSPLLLTFGLGSIGVAALFIIGPRHRQSSSPAPLRWQSCRRRLHQRRADCSCGGGREPGWCARSLRGGR